jgi:hypothetical protein
MNSHDHVRHELLLFLPAAADAMREFHSKAGRFAEHWAWLDMTFANGSYYVNDPDVRPKNTDKVTWKPRRCKYTYNIVEATATSFVIIAYEDDGTPIAKMTQAEKKPVALSDKVRDILE